MRSGTATTAHCMLIKLVGKTACKAKDTNQVYEEDLKTNLGIHMGIYAFERSPCMLGIVVVEAVPVLEGSVLNRERNCTKEPNEHRDTDFYQISNESHVSNQL